MESQLPDSITGDTVKGLHMSAKALTCCFPNLESSLSDSNGFLYWDLGVASFVSGDTITGMVSFVSGDTATGGV